MLRTLYPPLVDPLATIELSPNQAAVLGQVLLGHGNVRIATDLGCSIDTAKGTVSKIMKKAGAHNRAHLVALIYSGAVEALVPVGVPCA
jgi:DNA-binding CsgD family transcriptional regulator